MNQINEIIKNEILPASPKFSFLGSLLDYGFDRQLVEDWLKVRKTKKATNTETAFKNFIAELEQRTCNINEVLEITPQQIKKWETFKGNLLNGIDYYKSVFQEKNSKIQNDILQLELQLNKLEFNTIPV